MKYDFLIVGSGLAGSVLAERIATQLDKHVLMIDKRPHIAGNCYDYKNEHGIHVHQYGPHIFHTSNKKVHDYVLRFTRLLDYRHRVLCVVNGKTVPVPFNLTSIEKSFPPKVASRFIKKLTAKYGMEQKVPILKLLESNDSDLKLLAEYVYNNVFYNYTIKQWGMNPKELDFSVSSRIPVHISFDDCYFQDSWEGVPESGYSAMVQAMLNHSNIEVRLNTNYYDIKDDVRFDRLIYTGTIDEFFDFKYGYLPYRTCKFNFNTLNREFFQETSQVNYPNDFAFTRITEFKHFTKVQTSKTTITYEYPSKYIHGINEPFYPIPQNDNEILAEKYRREGEKLSPKVTFLGRLAEYRYYNMDQIIGVALSAFEKKILPYC